MASKLALRVLGAVALPGAFLAVAAPAASADQIAPLSGTNTETVSKSSDADAVPAGALPSTNELLSGKTLSL